MSLHCKEYVAYIDKNYHFESDALELMLNIIFIYSHAHIYILKQKYIESMSSGAQLYVFLNFIVE